MIRQTSYKIVLLLYLNLQIMFDVTVIGAGINGSWSALHLAKQGYKTVLVDQVFPFSNFP